MRITARSAAFTLAGLAGTTVVSLAAATRVWDRATRRAVDSLQRALEGHDPPALPASLDALPDPVARYFRFALGPDQRRPRTARLKQKGRFRGAPDAGWSDFKATAHLTLHPPGFVWDARIRVAPLVAVRVRDQYVEGRAGMLARLNGVVPMVRAEPRPGLDAGGLHRYLGEAVWLPPALLPSLHLTWAAVDARTARATLRDGETEVSLDFTFDEAGRVTRVYTSARMRDVDGKDVATPWEARLDEYVVFEGMQVPLSAEVSWLLPEGRFTYWQGRVVGATYGHG